jgi:hypothetical protein
MRHIAGMEVIRNAYNSLSENAKGMKEFRNFEIHDRTTLKIL